MAALVAYRHLLRATRTAFLGDPVLLNAARSQARQGFEKNSTVDVLSKEAANAIQHAEGVAQVLRHNVVQGQQKEGGDVLKLRIHKDTERAVLYMIQATYHELTLGRDHAFQRKKDFQPSSAVPNAVPCGNLSQLVFFPRRQSDHPQQYR